MSLVLHHQDFRLNNFTPKSANSFNNTKCAIKPWEWQNTITYTQNHYSNLKNTNISTKIPLTYYCPDFPRFFTQIDRKKWATNWIYDKKLYVQLKSLPKPWQFYTTAGCNGCDFLHVWKPASTAKEKLWTFWKHFGPTFMIFGCIFYLSETTYNFCWMSPLQCSGPIQSLSCDVRLCVCLSVPLF